MNFVFLRKKGEREGGKREGVRGKERVGERGRGRERDCVWARMNRPGGKGN